MTLEEAIKHCEEVAEKQEITAKSNLIEIDKIKADGILRLYDADEYESCMKCASDHRQLAEWLKELKDYREREFCRYCEERDTIIFDEPCKSCKIHFVRKEVNADEDSD